MLISVCGMVEKVFGKGTNAGPLFSNRSQEHSLPFSPRFVILNVTQLLIG